MSLKSKGEWGGDELVKDLKIPEFFDMKYLFRLSL